MSIDAHKALRDTLPSLEGLNAAEAHVAVLEAFEQAGYAVPASATATPDASAPGHLLVVWTEDYYGTTHVYAVPEEAISADLKRALTKVHGTGYAFDEIMGGVDYGADLLRLDVAMGQADWEDMLADYAYDMDPEIESKIPDDERDCMEPYQIASIEDDADPEFVDGGFGKRFVGVSISRRSM